MRVRFWGTRGSIATPGPRTVRYGGNTACVEANTRSGTRLVFDAGTGIRVLGEALIAQGGEAARRGHILIGHTHWDHIQGFPFFAPLFDAANSWDVYAPRGFGPSLRETLAGQMQYTYFPISLDALGATLRYHDLLEGSFSIDDCRVVTRYLNHPALTLGYRVETDGVVLVYSTDHECHSGAAGQLGKPLGETLRQTLGSMHPGDRRHADFVAGADLLIHDAQYTAAEYQKRVGWGHSTLEYVVDLALQAGVKRLALFHHDPCHDDAAIDAMLATGHQRIVNAGGTLELFAAAEGQVLELRAHAVARSRPQPDALAEVDTSAVASRTVLVACADAKLAQGMREAAQAEGLTVREAPDVQSALELSRREPLALAMVDQGLGPDAAQRLCRGLRQDRAAPALPVIVLAHDKQVPPAPAHGTPAPHVLAGGNPAPPRLDAEAATEWLTLPVTPQYLRTKMRAALLRTRARWERAPLPATESPRLDALRGLGLLDTPAEERFDRITRLAVRSFDVSIALVSLVDSERQWFKSRAGAIDAQTPRDQSFCAHTILRSDTLVVPDALLDPRFADSPLVTGAPRIRFYAGHPLFAPDGSAVGTFCLKDHRPRQFGDAELQLLADLAALVQRELGLPSP